MQEFTTTYVVPGACERDRPKKDRHDKKNEEKDTSPGLRNNSNNLIMNDKDQN